MEQQKVVDRLEGALLVLAPAGSGKTALLSARVARAVHAGIEPDKMLCLTFTNLAVRQLRDRVAKECPDQAGSIWISTFHGFCATLLRLEAGEAGLPSDFTICDEEDAEALVARLMKEKHLTQIENPNARNPRKDPYMKAPDVRGLFDLVRTTVGAGALSHGPYDGQDLPDPWQELFRLYIAELRRRHALDFADLICQVRELFVRREPVRRKWAQRFRFVQIDEVQDTHLAEYDVISVLAAGGNIAVYGDLDQSIYGWRGARPLGVRDRFVSDFKPILHTLPINYRATSSLIRAADGFAAKAFAKRHTRLVPDESCDKGSRVVCHTAPNEAGEAGWIAGRIRRHEEDGERFRNMAILCRTNKTAARLGNSLDEAGIPCMVAEEYNFFRRQEVKDAVAALRLLVDPHAVESAVRLALRHIGGVGLATIEEIMAKGEESGIRLDDFLDEGAVLAGDPFGPLLNAYDSGRIVVMDTESTGLSVTDDEIVEIAFCGLDKGKVAGEWSCLVKTTRPVGTSEYIHGISDAMLTREGIAPEDALERLFRGIGGAVVVGHNIGYDLALVSSQSRRLGMEYPHLESTDTHTLSRRFVKAPSYRLGELCMTLGIPSGTAHRALGDVQSTAGLLGALIPEVRKGAAERRALVARLGTRFRPAAEVLARWRLRIDRERPATVLEGLLRELGIRETYRNDGVRLGHLDRLVEIFRDREELGCPPREALRNLIQFAVMGKHLDVLVGKDDKVIVAPIHQSKGMEFDTVFIAGAVEGLMPIYMAEDIEEEKRLFYVAMTRPRKALYITGSRCVTVGDGWTMPKHPTPFLADIPQELVEWM